MLSEESKQRAIRTKKSDSKTKLIRSKKPLKTKLEMEGSTDPSIFSEELMRYHYEKPERYSMIYGSVYECDHPVYNKCTLFEIGDKGLGIIQQRYCERTKRTWWGEIDPWLADALYLHKDFISFFKERGGACEDGIYPTVSIRQIMWALKLKPIPRERWETCFDRRNI